MSCCVTSCGSPTPEGHDADVAPDTDLAHDANHPQDANSIRDSDPDPDAQDADIASDSDIAQDAELGPDADPGDSDLTPDTDIFTGDEILVSAYGDGTCDDSNVIAAISDARPGDRVIVPSGTCTWSEHIDINTSLSLRGQGPGSTIIYLDPPSGDHRVLLLDSSEGRTIEITGFSFEGVGSGRWNGFNRTAGDGTGAILIHDNEWEGTGSSQYLLSVHNRANVLIYRDVFTRTDGSQPLFFHSRNSAIASFSLPLAYGEEVSSSVEWSVVEDCTFYMSCNTQIWGVEVNSAVFDAQTGAKVRFRHNTVYNGYPISHASCWTANGSNGTGGYAAELYENRWIAEDGCYPYPLVEWMGGTTLFHNNTVEFWGTGHYQLDEISAPDIIGPHHYMDARTNQASRCWEDANWIGLDGPGGTFGLAYLTSNSTDTSWYTCDDTNENPQGPCTKRVCSNSWTVCSTDEECTGGTCDRSIDNDELGFNATGAGGLIVVDGVAMVENAPVYHWDNSWLECNASGESCVDHGEGSVQISDEDLSETCINGVNFFNDTPMPGYSPALYPDSRR